MFKQKVLKNKIKIYNTHMKRHILPNSIPCMGVNERDDTNPLVLLLLITLAEEAFNPPPP